MAGKTNESINGAQQEKVSLNRWHSWEKSSCFCFTWCALLLREENRLKEKSDVFKTVVVGSTAIRSLPPSGMQIPPALSGNHISGKYNPSSLL